MPRFHDENYGHFITTKTFRNKRLFHDPRCCEILLEDIKFYRKKLGFKLVGYVIMPDHIHLIVWWDVGKHPELTVSKIMRSIKSYSGNAIARYLHPGRRGPLTSSVKRSGQGTRPTPKEYPHRKMSEQKYNIWQPSFYDFNIYSDKKLEEKINYIHWNPVRAGLCKDPEDWPWSSFCEFVKTGYDKKIGE
ncbi:MAG: transposase [Patescibacteria group bacterium]